MEGLIDPYNFEFEQISYIIYKDEARCSIKGIWFVEREPYNFNIKEKINKLNEIIDNFLNKLINEPNQETKKNHIKMLEEKKSILTDLLNQYNELENNYIEFDKYNREQLFEFYKMEYERTWIFEFAKRKMYMAIMLNIQMIIKNKFNEFFNTYKKIRESFFRINNFIINIKKLYNTQI